MSRKLKEIFMLSLNNDLITFYASWITEIQYETCGKNILVLTKLDIPALYFTDINSELMFHLGKRPLGRTVMYPFFIVWQVCYV